jgi:hypothetical protein
MTAATIGRETFDIGRVVSRTFGAIGRSLPTLLVLAVLFYAVPSLVFQALQAKANPLLAPHGVTAASVTASFRYMGLLVVFGLASLALSAVLQAAVIHAVLTDADGRKSTIGDCLTTGARFALPVAGIALLSAIAIGFATLLLIFPALMLMTAWIAATPAAVVERTGVFAAFSRSGDLTRGHRWTIFALVFVFFIMAFIVQMAAVSVTGGLNFMATPNALAAAKSWPTMLVTAISGCLISVISSAGVASIYFELRTIKDGIGPTALAAVFD